MSYLETRVEILRRGFLFCTGASCLALSDDRRDNGSVKEMLPAADLCLDYSPVKFATEPWVLSLWEKVLLAVFEVKDF